MKNESLRGIKPIKTIRESIKYKGCYIGYEAADYGKGSSAFAYISYFTKNSYAYVCITLHEPTNNIMQAKKEIIKQAKEWINTRLIPTKD